MNLQSCTQENTFCGCLKLLSSNYKPTGPQLASVHFHAIYVQFYISGRIELGSNWSQAQGKTCDKPPKNKSEREREKIGTL